MTNEESNVDLLKEITRNAVMDSVKDEIRKMHSPEHEAFLKCLVGEITEDKDLKMSEWRPIGTAPKIGRILVCDKDGVISIAVWSQKYRSWIVFAGGFMVYDMSAEHAPSIRRVRNPTHWMSLPESPAKEESHDR